MSPMAMLLPGMHLTAMHAAPSSQDAPATDPIAVVRAFVAGGQYADAAEAIAGLPAVHRDREFANLWFQTFCLKSSRAAAKRALEADPEDSEMLRILADVDFTEGKYASARAGYVNARGALDADSRHSEADREQAKNVLTGRDTMLRSAESYRAIGAVAERKAILASGGLVAAILVLGLTALVLTRRFRSGA